MPDIPDVELAWLEGVAEEWVHQHQVSNSRRPLLQMVALAALRLAYERGKSLGAEGRLVAPMPERTEIPKLN